MRRNLLLLAALLLLGCQKEEPAPNDAPPIMGFGDLQTSLDITGELALTLYLNKEVRTATEVIATVSGDAILGVDYVFATDSIFRLEPGDFDASITLLPLPSDDGSRLDRTIELTLQPVAGIRLDESRKTVTIGFSLEHTVELSLWAKDETFPQLWGYTSFGPEPVPPGPGLDAGRHFCFAYKSKTEPNVIGFFNQDTTRSTNAFNMHRLYADYDVSTGSARIRIEKALRFIPDTEGATFGRVEIPEQQVEIRRSSSSGLPPFHVGLSGSGTYSEETGVIQVDVYFDETEIGNGPNILRKYVFEKDERE